MESEGQGEWTMKTRRTLLPVVLCALACAILLVGVPQWGRMREGRPPAPGEPCYPAQPPIAKPEPPEDALREAEPEVQAIDAVERQRAEPPAVRMQWRVNDERLNAFLALPRPMLRPVRWQLLPNHVDSAFVQPGGRIWWRVHLSPDADPDTICRIIELEFDRPSPMIPDTQILLFEPGGRVWFVLDFSRRLRAYDGKRWIMRDAEEGQSFSGSLPNSGRRYGPGSTCFLDGTVFVIGTHAVHCFDTRAGQWADLRVSEHSCRMNLLLPEPDRKGLVALYAAPQVDRITELGSRTSDATGDVLVWRWRGGRWTQMQTPGDLDARRIVGASVVGRGLWVEERNTDHRPSTEPVGLRFIPFDPDDHAEAAPLATFGPYVAKDVMLGFDDCMEAAFFRAKDVSLGDRSLGPGMIIDRRDGRFSLLRGERFLQDEAYHMAHEESGPILLPDRDAMWLPRKAHGPPAAFYSLADGRLIAELGNEVHTYIRGALPSGMVLATASNSRAEALLAYDPDAPDDRAVLKAIELGCESSAAGVAADGAFWLRSKCDPATGQAFPDRGEFIRFDGAQTSGPQLPKEFDEAQELLFGQDGMIFTRTRRGCLLYGNGGVLGAGDIETVIAANREAFVTAFAHGYLPERRHRAGGPSIDFTIDAESNVWLVNRRKLRVLAGNVWLDATAPLMANGSPEGIACYVDTVGDGGMVYASDLRQPRGEAKGFYGEAIDGALVFTPAPGSYHMGFNADAFVGIRSAEGALWVSSETPLGGSMMSRETWRLMGNFKEETLKDIGLPELCDKSGNVWLRWQNPDRTKRFNIWRDGKIAAFVDLPDERYWTPETLFSDRPGSVYIWSHSGLYHFTADDPAQPAAYALKGRYFVEGVRSQLSAAHVRLRGTIQYSSLGFIAVSSFEENKSVSHAYIIKLPE